MCQYSRFSKIRSHLAFKSLYSSAVEEACELTEDPVLPKQTHPCRINNGSPNHCFQSPKDFLGNSTLKNLICL